MRPFIKSISPYDPAVKPIMDAFGFEGYGRFVAVLDFCRDFGIYTLDEQLIINQARSNRRGAVKYLPIFQECLTNVLRKFGESSTKVSPNNDQTLPKVSPNITQSLPKLGGQNPFPDSALIEEKRVDQNKREEGRVEEKASATNTHPPTPILQSEYQPVLVFSNRTTKDTVLEEAWVLRGAMQAIKANPKAKVNHLGGNLAEFCAFNPDAKKMVYNWFRHPPATRMAAGAYAMKKPDATNEFIYALKAIDGSWQGYLELLPQCQKFIDAEDYVMEV